MVQQDIQQGSYIDSAKNPEMIVMVFNCTTVLGGRYGNNNRKRGVVGPVESDVEKDQQSVRRHEVQRQVISATKDYRSDIEKHVWGSQLALKDQRVPEQLRKVSQHHSGGILRKGNQQGERPVGGWA